MKLTKNEPYPQTWPKLLLRCVDDMVVLVKKSGGQVPEEYNITVLLTGSSYKLSTLEPKEFLPLPIGYSVTLTN